MESIPAVYGVVKRILDNNIDDHSNQQVKPVLETCNVSYLLMYSHSSYAKMKQGHGRCMHSDFHKPAQP